MPETQKIIEYLRKMSDLPEIIQADDAVIETMAYRAGEEIKMFFGDEVTIDERMLYLQTAYRLEGEEEGIAMMRRQGISEAKIKDTSVKLSGSGISPMLLLYMERQGYGDHEHPTSVTTPVARLK